MNENDSTNDGGRFGPNRTWARMFADAARGVWIAVRCEVNFVIHFAALTIAAALGWWANLSLDRWCLIALSATVALTAEMCNTAIEHLARAVTRESHPEVRDALDIAGGAVLVAVFGAVVVGLVVLGPPLAAAR
jgi:diacylglycerol kinase